jgi:hypothetical protein
MPSVRAQRLTGLLLEAPPDQRGRISQALLDRLATELKVPPVRVHVRQAPQKHRLKNGRLTYKEYAHYEDGGAITIYNITAVRRQTLAPKAFLDTLIHEFLHHLDYELLRLRYTYHTKGFYSRLGDLMAKLRGRIPHQLDLFGCG